MSETGSGGRGATGVAWSAFAISLATAPAVGYGAPGTGGSVSSHFLLHKGDWVYEEAIGEASPEANVDDAGPVDAADALALLRSALGLSVSDLAGVLDVSRPTIYAWMKREQEPRPAAWQRLQELQQVALRAESCALPRVSRLVRRPLADGRSLLDRLQAGESVDEHELQALSELAGAEQAQRDAAKGDDGRNRRSADDAAREYGRPGV